MLDVLERRERVEGGEVQPKDGNMLAGVRWGMGREVPGIAVVFGGAGLVWGSGGLRW